MFDLVSINAKKTVLNSSSSRVDILEQNFIVFFYEYVAYSSDEYFSVA